MRLLRKAIMPLIPVSLCVRPVVPGELSSNIFFLRQARLSGVAASGTF